MKNMAILIDTNVVLDFFLNRSPFSEQADKIMKHCIKGEVVGYLACHSILNAFYIARKERNIEERKQFLLMLCERFVVIGIDVDRIVLALLNDEWQDLEDGLQMQCAYDFDIDYIITRDSKGFESSKVPLLSPEDFLNLL